MFITQNPLVYDNMGDLSSEKIISNSPYWKPFS